MNVKILATKGIMDRESISSQSFHFVFSKHLFITVRQRQWTLLVIVKD